MVMEPNALFAGTGEFELIVAFQDQITQLVAYQCQAAEHKV